MHPNLKRLGARIHSAVGQPGWWVFFLLLLFSWPVARAMLTRLPPPLPRLGQVPALTLVEHSGDRFTNQDMAGRVWVAGFIFTRCPSVCPAITQQMETVRRRSKNLGDTLHLASFSVDPGYDTPEVLRAYAKQQGIRLERWHLLTGDTEGMREVVQGGFKILMGDAATASDLASVTHGTHLVLVDADGLIRGYYDSNSPDGLDLLLRDAGLLINRGGR